MSLATAERIQIPTPYKLITWAQGIPGSFAGGNFIPRIDRYNPLVASGDPNSSSGTTRSNSNPDTKAETLPDSRSNDQASSGGNTGGPGTSSQKDSRTDLNNSAGQNTKTTWWLLGTTIGLGVCSLIVRFTNFLGDFLGDGIVKTWVELGLYTGTTLFAALTTSSALALGNDTSDTKNLV